MRLAATVHGSCTTDTAVTQDEHTDYGNHADDYNAQSNNYYSSECTCGDGNACDDGGDGEGEGDGDDDSQRSTVDADNVGIGIGIDIDIGAVHNHEHENDDEGVGHT